MGIRFEMKYNFVETGEFLRFYKIPHTSAGLQTISGIMNEEGQFIEGVLIRHDARHPPPVELCCRTCILYSDIYNVVQEHILDEKHQLRASQHKELFEWVNSSAVQKRDACLRPAGRISCLHFKDLQAKVDEVQLARRSAAEQEAGQDPSMAPVPPPRRGVQAPTILPAPTRDGKKKKGKGKGGSGKGHAKGHAQLQRGLAREHLAVATRPSKRLKPDLPAEVEGLGSVSRLPEAGQRSEASEVALEPLSVPAVLAGANFGRALVNVRSPDLIGCEVFAVRPCAGFAACFLAVMFAFWLSVTFCARLPDVAAAKLEKRVKAMQEAGQALESEELNQKCMALRAAEALQQHKLTRMKFTEMERFVGVLMDCGVDLPASLQCAVTRQYCQDMLQAGHLDKWKHAFRPFSPTGSGAELEWTLSSPTFSPCACMLDLGDGNLKSDVFSEAWLDSFFCDYLMQIITDADGAAAVQLMCGATLDLHNEFQALRSTTSSEAVSSDAVSPDHMLGVTSSDAVSARCCIQLLDSVATVARGLLAVLSPVPGYRGSTLDDVNFVFPTSTRGTTRHMGDLCSRAKTIVVKMRELQHWIAAKDQYKAHMAVESGILHKFQALSARLQKQETLPLKERQALRQDAIAALRPWQEKLRPGATCAMEEAVLLGIKADWHECTQLRQQWLQQQQQQQQEPSCNTGEEVASLQVADCLIQDLKVMAKLSAGRATSAALESLTQDILEQRLEWARHNVRAALRAAVQRQLGVGSARGSASDPAATLQELQAALKNAASTGVDQETWADLFKLRPNLWTVMADAIKARASSDAATEPDPCRHVELSLAVLQEIESLAADNVADPVYNNFSLAAPMKVAGGILAIRKNALELENAKGPSTQVSLYSVASAHESIVRMDNQYREKVPGDAGTTVTVMLDAYQHHIRSRVLTMLSDCSRAIATELCTSLLLLCDQLSAINSGNPRSPAEKWDAGLPSRCTLKQVLEHAKVTLHEADGKSIDSSTKQLKKVARHMGCRGIRRLKDKTLPSFSAGQVVGSSEVPFKVLRSLGGRSCRNCSNLGNQWSTLNHV